jgi:CubicO group peptidase (beta-lactamase class C family)
MRRIAVHLGLIAVALACLPAAVTASSEPRFQRVLETALANQPVSPGIAAAVDRPGLRWRGAAGVLDRASSLPLRASDGYRIASITKTFTAAAILRLVEPGKLALQAPVKRYLPAAYTRALRADGYDPSRITVRMLLRHTAGLFDHSADDAYLQALLADPGRRWSRIEQVRFAMANGEPVAPPGRRYSYSDTGTSCSGRSSSPSPAGHKRRPTGGCSASVVSASVRRTSRRSSPSRAAPVAKPTSTSAISTRPWCSTPRTISSAAEGW